jgi:hypothetical protein
LELGQVETLLLGQQPRNSSTESQAQVIRPPMSDPIGIDIAPALVSVQLN